MRNVDPNVICFQCPRCGHDLHQTVGHLKAERRLVCDDCGVGINFDTSKLVQATAALQEALEFVPDEITIRFFRTAS